MKIFNLENPPKGVPAGKTECIVIATFDEWKEISIAIDEAVKAHPKKKKLVAIQSDMENMSVW